MKYLGNDVMWYNYVRSVTLQGYTKKGAYIATQGPLKNTIEDFWRMVWEKEVHVIVMLAMLEEKGKVRQAEGWEGGGMGGGWRNGRRVEGWEEGGGMGGGWRDRRVEGWESRG